MKTKKPKKFKAPRNFVAKYANEVCKAATHRDRKCGYTRKPKHPPREDV